MWLMVDNYDSFSYILADYLLRIHSDIKVIKNDEYSIEEIIEMRPERIIISPGPGHPSEVNLLPSLIKHFQDSTPILGICLGHQAIGLFYGAKCLPSGTPKLGKVSPLTINYKHPLLKNIDSNDASIMHYHSLIISSLDNTTLINVAEDNDGMNMIIVHRSNRNIIGIQFHPESILTNIGMQLLINWKDMYNEH